MLHELPPHERNILIEDTEELRLPNSSAAVYWLGWMPMNNWHRFHKAYWCAKLFVCVPIASCWEKFAAKKRRIFNGPSTGHEGNLAMPMILNRPWYAWRCWCKWPAPNGPRIHTSIAAVKFKFSDSVSTSPNGKRSLGGIYKVGSLESFGLLLEKCIRPQLIFVLRQSNFKACGICSRNQS